MSVADCRLIELPKISNPQGNLTVIEGQTQVPFDIRRTYYLYDIPGGAIRGGHAHRSLQQLIIAIAGSFEVTLDDGENKKTFFLNRPYCGLYVCPMIWRILENFSSGAVCLVLASDLYDEADYYRDYEDFLAGIKHAK